MPGIFLAPSAPVAGPDVPQLPVARLRFVWHGWDGSTWDFSDPDGSGVRLRAGVVGLKLPGNIQFYSSESASVDGQEDRGWRLPARDVIWPISVFSGPGQEWVDHDRAFWRTLQPGRTGTWEVIAPDGQSRTLRLRVNPSSEQAFDYNPSRLGWAQYGVRLLAVDPYWRGQPIIREWETTSSADFFGGATKGPPFYISSGASIATASMTNPGDVPEWPVWTGFGPFSRADFGLEGRITEAHFTVNDGEALVVDTNPRRQTAFLYDAPGKVIDYGSAAEVTSQLGAVDFVPVPPQDDVQLSLSMVGTGSVQCSITPGYFEAY